jgi:hypothetical protein
VLHFVDGANALSSESIGYKTLVKAASEAAPSELNGMSQSSRMIIQVVLSAAALRVTHANIFL